MLLNMLTQYKDFLWINSGSLGRYKFYDIAVAVEDFVTEEFCARIICKKNMIILTQEE